MSKTVMAIVALLSLFILGESSDLKKFFLPEGDSDAGRKLRTIYNTCKWCSILLLGLCVYHVVLMILEQWK